MSTYDPEHIPEKVYARIGQKALIMNDENKLLVLRRSDKCTRPLGWDFPGGGLDFGEDPIKGIQREVKEETGLEITAFIPLELYSYREDEDFIVIIAYKAKTSKVEIDLSWEHDIYQWISLEEAVKLEWPKGHRKFLEKLLISK